MNTQPRYASIYINVPKRQSFTYQLPSSVEDLKPGQLVRVPVGKRESIGMIQSIHSDAPENISAIKEILEVLPSDLSLSTELLELFEWAQKHYLAFPSEMLKSFFPASLLRGQLTPPVRAKERKLPDHFISPQQFQLTPGQQLIIDEIQKHWGEFYPSLIQGVTGSGKTEIYLQLGEQALKGEGSTLVLVPEIALTPQTVGRFVGRFGETVAAYHSEMTEAQRLKTWWQVRRGEKKIVVGTRSALFLPLKNLKLMVVDEEHDASYKQEERFRYHARDLAVLRAKLEGVPILLGSATPSLESFENAQRRKYHHFILPERATNSRLPQVELIDLKKYPQDPKTLLTDPLRAALEETLSRGEQALLFYNRRGFSPFLLCRDCGEVPSCPNCEISLTFHKSKNQLKCHYCEFVLPAMQVCPACRSDSLKSMGAGTEKIEENLRGLFPDARIARLDSDVISKRTELEKILEQFSQGEIDILLGTQLLTKGHDFPKLTLVGILLADVALHFPDFRASERLFQLLTQVSGRAGRRELEGKVYLQTLKTHHAAIQSALTQEVGSFLKQESQMRQEIFYPPFARIVLLRVSGLKKNLVEKAALQTFKDLQSLFQKYTQVKILGPAPAFFEKLRGKFRWQILLSAAQFEPVRKALEMNLALLEEKLPPGIQLSVDVDPVGAF